MPLNGEDYELLPSANPVQSSQERQEQKMGKEEHTLKPEGRAGDLMAKNASLTAAGLLLVTTWTIVFTSNPTAAGWFALHPLLQTLAILLFTYGILTLQPTSQPKTKVAGLLRHQVAILLIGLPSILFGTFAVFYNKILGNKNHFVTWHGKLGLLCMIWLLFQAGLGAASVWFGGAAFGGGAKAKAVWKYHRLSGYFLFPLLILTVHLGGGWSHWAEKYSTWGVRIIAYTIAPVVILASVYSRIRISKMQFL